MSLTPIRSLLFLAAALVALQGCVAVMAGGAAGGSLAGDRRTAGAIVEDQSIELKIANAIARDDTIPADKVHIAVTSFNGTVLLTGETSTAELKEKVEKYARDTEKVRKVYNELRISEPTTHQERNMDTWLTTKVKTKIVGTKGVHALHVKVLTSAQTVYLMGLVTRNEAEAAAQAASDITNVDRVVKTFEYLD